MKNLELESFNHSFYEVPMLKKYGNMKSIVQGGNGSAGDEMTSGGRSGDPTLTDSNEIPILNDTTVSDNSIFATDPTTNNVRLAPPGVDPGFGSGNVDT